MGFNFEKLDVYQKANEFVTQVYSLTKSFPKEEMFGLTAQFRRAAVSIPLNIAEGSARSKKEFTRFVDIARGSILECATILEISRKQKYIDDKEHNDLKDGLVELAKMLSGLKRSLKSRTHKYQLRTTNYEL